MNAKIFGAVALLFSLPAIAKPPRLTLFVSVDSFGSDVLLRSRPKLKGGLATMIRDGAYFPTARYGYVECVTAAGHATLATGANPWRHGIVSNKVMNRSNGKLEPVFVDDSHPILEAPIGHDDVSPANLLAETLSDRVRLSTQGQGKAVAIAGKARAAIALGGKLGQAWWFSEAVGKFVSGTWYVKEFPTWVKGFNDKKLPDGFHGKQWTLLEAQKEYLGEDDRVGESDWYAMGRTFPHPLSGGLEKPGPQSYSALASSPFLNELTVAFAKAAIDGEQMGKDDVPDLLSVSFSAVDRTYHLYGPYSWEAQDQILRLDKALGELIAAAEKAAGGRQNLVVVVSADHGGANIPEQWAAQSLDGARVPPANLDKALEKELAAKFNGGDLVIGIEEMDVYLDHKAIADKKLDLIAVRKHAAQFLGKLPEVAVALSRDDFEHPDTTSGWLKNFRRGYYPDRSGDVLFMLKPFRVLESEPAGTSHGQPYAYDAEVPLILLGRGVKPGVYPQIIEVTDIATTTAALMEMGNPGSAEGAVRSEALSISAK